MLPTEEAMLDNPGYASLCGAHARFAQVRGRARRYLDDVAPFLALPSPPSPQDWRDAAGLVAPGAFVAGDPALRGARLSRAPTRDADGRNARAASRR
jgi:hypothetical protein